MIDNKDMPWPAKQLIYAFDFDDTFTADPKTHSETIRLWQRAGHRVVCISARPDTFENRQELTAALPPGVDVYLCYDTPKKLYAQQHGLSVDIWLDDMPEAIVDWDSGRPQRLTRLIPDPVEPKHDVQLRRYLQQANRERLESLVTELADALRELHDFAVPDTHYRHCTPSKKAFSVAAKLLKRLGK